MARLGGSSRVDRGGSSSPQENPCLVGWLPERSRESLPSNGTPEAEAGVLGRRRRMIGDTRKLGPARPVIDADFHGADPCSSVTEAAAVLLNRGSEGGPPPRPQSLSTYRDGVRGGER